MSTPDLSHEERFEWIDDPSKYHTLTESFALGGTRAGGLKRAFSQNGRLLGWACLKASAPSDRSRMFQRRVFYVRQYLLDEHGEAAPGTYPRTIEPGKAFSSQA
jgi:hypothetical protein